MKARSGTGSGGGFQPCERTGQLFRNERKSKPTHPDHTGAVMLGGVLYRISAWVKDGQRGRFFSLELTPEGEGRGVQIADTPATTQQPLASGYQPKQREPWVPVEPKAARGGPRLPVRDEEIPF